jgi:hypothetical protein
MEEDKMEFIGMPGNTGATLEKKNSVLNLIENHSHGVRLAQ